jgi:hypothetical protein
MLPIIGSSVIGLGALALFLATLRINAPVRRSTNRK